jgi:hypothetical protein
MADGDEPATKRDLAVLRGEMREMGGQLRGEMREMGDQIRGEMREMGDQIRGEMREMEQRLVIGLTRVIETQVKSAVDDALQRALAIQAEQFRTWLGAVDEKYADLPARVEHLEHDVAELKAPPPTPRRKRSAR